MAGMQVAMRIDFKNCPHRYVDPDFLYAASTNFSNFLTSGSVNGVPRAFVP